MRALLLLWLGAAAACRSSQSTSADLGATADLAQPVYACTRPLADYCGTADLGNFFAANACLPANEIVARLCPPDAGAPAEHVHAFLSDCGDYQSVQFTYVDSSTSSYYDKASGALVAVIDYSNSGIACDAGPATFAVPSCQPRVTLCP